jgi:hypothetical protein
LRGAHPVFDELRKNGNDETDETNISPFTLPSGSVHNVFHPSDPIAYRIGTCTLRINIDTTKLVF